MGEAKKPERLNDPITAEELEAQKSYSRRLRDLAGGAALALRPEEQIVVSAVNEIDSCRAHMAMCHEQMSLLEHDSLEYAHYYRESQECRHRLRRALRDAGYMDEALALYPGDAGLLAAQQAHKRDDTDFVCAAGCRCDVFTVLGTPKEITRWEQVKHPVPRLTGDGFADYVYLWRCRKCGEMNATPNIPPCAVHILEAHTLGAGLAADAERESDTQVLRDAKK